MLMSAATESTSGSDPFAVWAFAISIVAAVTGVSALLWNVRAWKRSGPHVVAEAQYIRDDQQVWQTVVRVLNDGRLGVDVTGPNLEWHRATPRRTTKEWAMLMSGKSSHRLEPHASWTVELTPMVWTNAPPKTVKWIRYSFALGNGKVIRTNKIPAEGPPL